MSITIDPSVWPQTNGGLGLDGSIERRVAEILSKMTLAEKVGQVVQADMNSITVEEAKQYRLGSILAGGNSGPDGKPYAGVAEWIQSSDAYWDALMQTREDGGVNIPPLLGIDAVHGHNNVIGATLFPHNIGLGATRDPDLIKRIAEVTARELVVTGHDWTFAPTLAVARDDRWGRTYESYSEAPEIVASFAKQMVEGLQGSAAEGNLFGDGKVISTAKHFVGDGGTVNGKDQGDNVDSEADLRNIHAVGYPVAIEAGVQSVMASFSSWHGEKLHGHKPLLNDVLKQRMNFNGFVVGDWNGHGVIKNSSATDCPQAINSGLDMYMAPDSWRGLYTSLGQQVESGVISEARLDDAVRRILRVKIVSGLFDKPKPSQRKFAGDESILGASEHRAIAREAVRKSLVLLKNDGVLPLHPKQKILVAGSAADSVSQASGGWSLTWQGSSPQRSDFPNAQTVLSGIEEKVNAVGGSVEFSVDGKVTEKPDVAIVVFGETPYAEFMGDISHLGYDVKAEKEINMLRDFQEQGIPVVSVFISGRPLWVNAELNASNAFVAAWLPGTEGGGVADVLFTQADGSLAYDFHGRLAFSWPNTAGQTPLNIGEANYKPLFPYGFGLNYAEVNDLGVLHEDADLDKSLITGSNVFFREGKVQDPWKIFYSAASMQTWEILDDKNKAETILDFQRIDKNMQEDAWRIKWQGCEEGQVFIAQKDGQSDFKREAIGDLDLAFDLQVMQKPTERFYIGMGTSGLQERTLNTLDFSNILRSVKPGQWNTYRIKLKYFENAEYNFENTCVAFLLKTCGQAEIAFTNVRLESEADADSICLV